MNSFAVGGLHLKKRLQLIMRKGIPTTWANKEGSSQMHYPHVGFLKVQEGDIRQIKEHTQTVSTNVNSFSLKRCRVRLYRRGKSKFNPSVWYKSN